MDFTKFDVVILFTMSFAIIILSFTFPAVGLADSSNETAESDVPEFNISSSKWDIAGDFPDDPGTPAQGVLEWEESLGGNSQNEVTLHGDTTDGVQMSLVNTGTGSQPDMLVTVTNWTSGSSVSETYNVTNEQVNDDGIFFHDNYSYEIYLEIETYENVGGDSFENDVSWELREMPEDEGWIDRIPVIGGIFSAAEQLASVLAWFGAIIWWAVATSFEIALAVIGTLLDVMVFGVDVLVWLSTTYTDVITTAEGWASVIMLIPGLLVSLEFGKIAMIGVSLLPFT